MILIPAIDLIQGQAVRLTKGEFNQKKVYPFSPMEYAKRWVNQGAQMIHLVDLEATLEGRPVNHKVIENIRAHVTVPLEVGGGIRNRETFEQWVACGIDRVVLGTMALEKRFIKQITKDHSDRLVVSLDCREGKVQTKGWITSTNVNYCDLAKKLVDLGVKHFIYTDISKDGVLEGPNIDGLIALLESTPASVVLSGGISHIDDIRKVSKLNHPNLFGIIIGKALYEEKINLGQAVHMLSEVHA